MKQTAVEWLIEQIKVDQKEQAFSEMAWTKIFEQAKEMEREKVASNCSQVEVTDDEIQKSMFKYNITDFGQMAAYQVGAKWAIEKFKQK